MATIQLFSPLAIRSNRLTADYYIYIYEYKNGKRKFRAYSGVVTKPFIYLQSTSITPEIFLKTYFTNETEQNGWRVQIN